MAIVSLLGAPQARLFEIIYDENPELREFPLDWYQLSEPKVQVGARTRISLVGDARKHSEPRLSGIRNVFYNRVDLTQLIRHQKPLIVYGATTKRSLTAYMARQWGIELNPELIVDGPIDPDGTELTLTFQNHKYLLVDDALTFQYVWAETTAVETLFTEPMLSGHDLPWPYPTALKNLFEVDQLNGLAAPSLLMHMPTVSRYWAVFDEATAQWLASREVGGSYSPNTLVAAVVMASSGAYPWQCVDSENAQYNLWASEIVYNGLSEGVMSSIATHVLKLRPNTTDYHQGIGEILIHYNG